MKALLLDVMENKIQVVNPEGLKDYYKLLGCELVDIVNRGIKGKRYEIICDDEGLLKANPKISGIDDMGQAMFVGNLIIAGETDDNGNLTDLSEEDLEHIQKNINWMSTRKFPEEYYMLCQVEY